MSRAIVYCEREEVALELVGAARSLGCAPVAICELADEQETGHLSPGAAAADEAHRFRLPHGEAWMAETTVGVLAELASAGEAPVVLLGSTRRGKALAGRLAQRIGAGCVTDALALRLENGSIVADRYALGGSTVASERILTDAKVFAVMPGAFPSEPLEGRQPTVTVMEHGALRQPARARVVERRAKAVEGASIESATVLVGAGKGFRKREDLSLAEELARTLHGEVGCTRAIASELAWLSEERLIGLSGKRCRPRLYVALGVSGQVQHAVGIAGARIIVAVNIDKEAPIFRLSDYGIVADLYRIVPEMVRQLGGGGQ